MRIIKTNSDIFSFLYYFTPFYHLVSYHSSHILAFCPSYFDICKERSTFASKLKNDEDRKNNPSPLA